MTGSPHRVVSSRLFGELAVWEEVPRRGFRVIEDSGPLKVRFQVQGLSASEVAADS